MSMKEWAKREVELACKKENPDRKDGEFDYGCACYESALKAYESLCEDGHSGFSFSVTRNILNRLMNELPLTPIIDTDDIWNECTEYDNKKMYQCKRMSSLFKNVYENGEITFTDVSRYYCFNEQDPDITFTSGLGSTILDKYYPIELPYFPTVGKYKVCVSDYLTDSKNGDFDTQAVWYIRTPTGEIKEVNRYYGEINGKLVEISKGEFDKRVKMHNERIKSLKEKENE